MASIDYCLRLLESDGDKLFREYEKNLSAFRSRVSKTGGRFICLESKISRPQSEGVKRQTPRPSHGLRTDWNRPPVFFDYDPGKIVIVTKGTPLNGAKLADILHNEHKIEIERVYDEYVIAMTSFCDTPEGFDRLASALCAIDETF
jgi:arginine/lysine/ornithine decarboxylase